MGTVPMTKEFEAKLKEFITKKGLDVNPACQELFLFLYEEMREIVEDQRDALDNRVSAVERTLWQKNENE